MNSNRILSRQKTILQKLKYSCCVIIFFITTLTLTVNGEIAPSLSINWQKLEFQQQIKSDLIKTLSSILGSEFFVLNVDVKLKPIAPKQKKETKLKIQATENHNEETLLLSKLGVLVTPKIDEAPATEIEPIDETPDLFNLIEKIRINCIIDASISESRFLIIKKVIQNQFLQYSPSLVDIKLEKAAIAKPLPPEKKEIPPPIIEKTFGEKFEPFKLPISIFLSFFAVMIMMLILFKASKPLPTAAPTGPTSEASPAHQEPIKEHSPTVSHSEPQHQNQSQLHSPADNQDIKLTTEKFKILLHTNEKATKLLVQEWIKIESHLTIKTIQTITKYLSLEEFTQLTFDFDLILKKKLKKIMGTTADEQISNSEVLQFIRSQIFMCVLSDSTELTEDNKKFLTTIQAAEIAELTKNNPDLASGIINLVSPELVAQAFGLIESANVEKLLNLSLQFKMKDFVTKLPKVEKIIKEAREKSKIELSPVLDDVEKLITQVSPEVEAHIFGALVQAKAFALIEELAKKYFPASLILKLELPKLNSILQRMPLTKRAELLLALDDSDRAILYKSFGDSLKVKELIDSEIESIQHDHSKKKSIEMTRALIWKQFVNLVRQSLQTDPILLENSQTVLKSWIEERKTGPVKLKAA